MKVQIRKGLFETNSSSTHAVTILNDEEYRKYINGDLMISRNAKLITKDEYNKILTEAYTNHFNKVKKIWDNPNTTLYKYYHDKYATLREAVDKTYNINDYIYDYNEAHMDVEHVEKEINGVKVHALSVYGYDD